MHGPGCPEEAGPGSGGRGASGQGGPGQDGAAGLEEEAHLWPREWGSGLGQQMGTGWQGPLAP